MGQGCIIFFPYFDQYLRNQIFTDKFYERLFCLLNKNGILDELEFAGAM